MMMGETKPNFALDLSNEGVALWHRAGGGGWTVLGHVPLDAPDLSAQVRALRDQALSNGAGNARQRRTVVRVPRSEVMLSKVSLGVFEDEAAERHGLRQIEKISPLPMDEIVFDMGEKGFGNMAPVGIVARQTLQEAEDFAKTHGFDTLYFTTEYSEREFHREPRFYLTDQTVASKPLWFAPWVAAASVGLAIGYFGYSQITSDASGYDAPPAVAAVEQSTGTEVSGDTGQQTAALSLDANTAAPSEAVSTPEPQEEAVADKPEVEDESEVADTTQQLALQDIAPNLPFVRIALNAPAQTTYPELSTKAVPRNTATDRPYIIRLQTEESVSPAVVGDSKLVKTSSLQIAEARRDLPEVAVNDEIVEIIQSDMALAIYAPTEPETPVRLAALTLPSRSFDPILLGNLPAVDRDAAPVPDAAQKPAARPVRPPSTITAEPGTLTPTKEGTPGPEYIMIFAGKPAQTPPDRPGSAIPADPLTGFTPRLRPDTLDVPETAVEEPAAEALLAENTAPQETTPQTILDLADPALRPYRARVRPSDLDVPEPGPAFGPPTIAQLADPALRPLRAKLRPATLDVPDQVAVTSPEPAPVSEVIATPAAETESDAPTLETTVAEIADEADVDAETAAIARTEAQEAIESATSLALANPALRPLVRPTDLAEDLEVATPENPATDEATEDAVVDTVEQPEAPTLTALADPALAGVKARNRPTNLRVLTPFEMDGLVALADPALAGKKSRSRPSALRVIAPEPEPEPEAEILVASTQPQNTIASASRFAIDQSPQPKARPARLDRVVKRVAAAEPRATGGNTKTTAQTPKAAVGTVKAPPTPTRTSVANAATERSKFRSSRLSLVGVFGTPSARRALVRTSTGRYVKVKAGDSLGGWRVSAIGADSLRIKKGSRDQVLKIP
ncbi:hypothetical protein [Neptunicoccus cionae]|uniref:Uncharacterized protein n=1 Tax=Neptunicoccus cionae TaxID=2035344 RepID=A0A916VMS8_9RHOB|nr:hypothetical protein [Amylibacter cionae]GGA09542.1 hypothetical protein GCM10011498_06950 [Amylibacter cionae]